MEIPSFDECQKKKLKEMNPLEVFVYENEPAGPDGEIFRERLSYLLEWVDSQQWKEPKQ